MLGSRGGMETVHTRVGGDLTPAPSSSGTALSRACAAEFAANRRCLTERGRHSGIPALTVEQEVLVPVNLSFPTTGGRATPFLDWHVIVVGRTP